MSWKLYTALGAAGVGTLIGLSGLYRVSETQQAVVTTMGRPSLVVVGSEEPGQIDEEHLQEVTEWVREYEERMGYEEGSIEVEGSAEKLLRWKWPFFQSCKKLSDLVLVYNADPNDVTTKDKRQLSVDNYARWRIDNPLLFYQRVHDERGALLRLDDVIYSVLREEIAQHNLHEIVRTDNDPIQTIEGEKTLEHVDYGRENILNDIVDQVNNGTFLEDGTYQEGTKSLGIEVIDVRIITAELPPGNEEAVYQRMIAERERIASLYKSEGEGESRAIKAETDRDAAEILSEAYKEAEQIRGEGDAESTRIYAEAYSQDEEFFQFWRTLEAYKTAFEEGDTTIVMSGDSEFNQFLLDFENLEKGD